jgi:hypothetical protein
MFVFIHEIFIYRFLNTCTYATHTHTHTHNISIYCSTAHGNLGRFFSFLIYTESVGLLGRGISPSQGRYAHTEQHKHRINTINTDIQALSGFRIHDPSVRAGDDGSCLRLRPSGQCDRHEHARTHIHTVP